MFNRYHRLKYVFIIIVIISTACTTTSQVRRGDFTKGGRKDPFKASKGKLVLYSTSYDKKLGDHAEKQIIGKEYFLYKDAGLEKYIRTIGNKIIDEALIDRGGVDYQFYILDDPVINAFALPNGHMYITRGILTVFDNEAQLATIMGHEVGHVVERHSIKQIQGRQMLDIGFSILTKGRNPGMVEDIGMGLIAVSYGRSDEFKSDALGMRYAYMAGYDVSEMTKVFDEFGKRDPGNIPVFFRTHPLDKDRILQIRGLWDLILTRKDIRPGSTPLKVGADEYAKIVFPHTYRSYFPEAEASFMSANTAFGKKDIDKLMEYYSKKFSSKWLDKKYRDMKSHYEELFGSVEKISTKVEVREFRFLSKENISFLCHRTDIYKYDDGRETVNDVKEIIYMARPSAKRKSKTDDTKSDGGPPSPPPEPDEDEGRQWLIYDIEDGGTW